ncbi:MAG: glycosyltransferase family 39 protein [Thermodesulfovibrionales bacterium]
MIKTNHQNSLLKQFLFLGALIVSVFLYTYHLTGDLYGDERGHTYNVIAFGNFWTNIQDPSMSHPPLYFMLAKLSYNITGKPWGMRIPSMLFAVGTVIVASLAAKKILGEKYFLPAAWLTALSPFVLEFSAEGRTYAMVIFFSVASCWAFIEFLAKENVPNMIWLSVASICGAMTHYFFWFQLIFFTVYYIAVKRKITRYSLGVFIISAIFLIPFPVLIFFIQKSQFKRVLQVDWSGAYFSITNFLGRLYLVISYGYSALWLPSLDPARNVPVIQSIKANWFLVILIAISSAGMFLAWLKLAKERARLFWFFILGAAIPVILGLIAAKSGMYLIREKHLAIIWIFYFFLFLMALDYLVKRKWGWFVIGCQMIVVFISICHYIVLPNEYTRRMDWTGLIQTLERDAQKSDYVILYLYDIEDLSLKETKIWDKGIKKIRLYNDKPVGLSIPDYVGYLDQSVSGTIYVVNNETDRHIVDPNSELLKALGKQRTTSEKRFGRNLILYSFIRTGVQNK